MIYLPSTECLVHFPRSVKKKDFPAKAMIYVFVIVSVLMFGTGCGTTRSCRKPPHVIFRPGFPAPRPQ